jgi:photosystem II Psb27 protein
MAVRRSTMLQMGGVVSDEPISPAMTAGVSLKQAALPFALLATFASVVAPALAAEEAVVPKVKAELGPVPTDWGLKYEYYGDSQKVVNHMRYAVQMEKGNPDLASVATQTKAEINDFVSYYRRFQGISGKQSFSLLYTSINVLAGHYTSYGTTSKYITFSFHDLFHFGFVNTLSHLVPHEYLVAAHSTSLFSSCHISPSIHHASHISSSVLYFLQCSFITIHLVTSRLTL